MPSSKIKLVIIFLAVAIAGFVFYASNFIKSIPKLDPINSPSPLVTTPTGSSAGDLSNLIVVDEPAPGQVVKSPLLVTGKARGTWYFEASFPVKIYDANGVELGVIPAQAQGEWMTEDFVPFRAVLYFKKPSTEKGVLVLQKDNPSGLPEYDAELRLPVLFDLANWPASSACKVTGCSGQVCSDEDVVTTCEYKAEYACYKNAKCERQEDGKCGWTPSEELVTCITTAWESEGNTSQ